MSPLPPSAITIVNGENAISAEVPAHKFGLSAEALEAEMRRGIVDSFVEKGVDKDAGRTRLTFHYRTHMWSLVVKPDGTLIESAAPAAKAPPANADHLSLLDFVGTMS